MTYKGSLKIIFFILCTFCAQVNYTQEVRLIDNKGTLKTVNNNRVFTSATDPNLPTVEAVENDVWIDTSTTPNTINIYNGTAWVSLTHKGTKGSVFFAGTGGFPTEDNSQLFWKEAGVDGNRLGVGTNTPTHKLHVTGAIRSEGMINSNGSATEPSYSFTGDTDTGMFWQATSQLGFTTDGIEALNIDNTQYVNVLNNLSVAGTYKDTSGDVGTNGQVLTSTITGTNWVTSPSVAPGNIKHGIQPSDHNGWYLLDGRAITTLPATAQTNAGTLGLSGNLPNATDRVLKHPNVGQALKTPGGAATTTLTQSNLPNVNFTGNTTSNGSHTHTISGTSKNARAAGGFNTYEIDNGTTATSINGNHNHTVTLPSGGTGQTFERYQPYLVVNTFIYLGL